MVMLGNLSENLICSENREGFWASQNKWYQGKKNNTCKVFELRGTNDIKVKKIIRVSQIPCIVFIIFYLQNPRQNVEKKFTVENGW